MCAHIGNIVRFSLTLCSARGFNKFLHQWVVKSTRRVYFQKARRAFDPRGVRGHAPPEKFEFLDSHRCIFMHFQVFFCCFVVSFFCS